MLKDLHAGRGRWFDLMNLGRTSNNNQWLNNPPVRSSGGFFSILCLSLFSFKHYKASLCLIEKNLFAAVFEK